MPDPKLAVVEHGAIAGCIDVFLVLFFALLACYSFNGVNFGYFLGTTPAVTATAYLSHVSVAAVPWYFRGANEAVGWVLWIARVLQSDVSIWVARTLVLLVGSAIVSWFVVQAATFLVHLAVAVFLELASLVAKGACAIGDVVKSRCVFISRWDSVSAVMLMLHLRKSRPKLHLSKHSRSGSQFVSKKTRRMGALATQATMFPEMYVPVTIPRCFQYHRKEWTKVMGTKIENGQAYSLLDMSLPAAPSSNWFERALHRGGWRSALLCPWHIIRSVAYWGRQALNVIPGIVRSVVALTFRLWWFSARLVRSSVMLCSKCASSHGRLGILLSALVAVLGDSPMCSLYQQPVAQEVQPAGVNWSMFFVHFLLVVAASLVYSRFRRLQRRS